MLLLHIDLNLKVSQEIKIKVSESLTPVSNTILKNLISNQVNQNMESLLKCIEDLITLYKLNSKIS